MPEGMAHFALREATGAASGCKAYEVHWISWIPWDMLPCYLLCTIREVQSRDIGPTFPLPSRDTHHASCVVYCRLMPRSFSCRSAW